jgi:hypothetical protein
MRAGARWKGNLGNSTNYSLVYLYTHQFAPAIPLSGTFRTQQFPKADPDTGLITSTEILDSSVTQEIVVGFPRQHIAGFSVEQAITSLGTVARLEAAFEPNRTFAGRTNAPDPRFPTRLVFQNEEMLAVNYAVVLQRPTMIRFLNPSSNFLLVAQFFHSAVPQLDMESPEGKLLTQVPGYNEWPLQKHSYRVVGVARTSYLNGRITLGLMGVYMPNPYAKDSGFYSIDVGFRMGPHYRLNIVATDFVGKDPYRDLGLFRDRDELSANLTLLF